MPSASAGVITTVAPAAFAVAATVTVSTSFATEAVNTAVSASNAGDSVAAVPPESVSVSALSVESGTTQAAPPLVRQTSTLVPRGGRVPVKKLDQK